MHQFEDKKAFSITKFMQTWGVLVLIVGDLTWNGFRDKIAGGLPQLSQAVAGQQCLLKEQQLSINKLETFKEVQDLINTTNDKKLDDISADVKALLRRIPPPDKYSGGDDRGTRRGQ